MRLINLTIGGFDHECDEEEAVEMFLELKRGLEEAGVQTEKLSTLPRPKGCQTFRRASQGAGHELSDC